MNKAQAYDTFWNSFGWKAYDEYTPLDEKDMPKQYIAYNFAQDALDVDVPLHVYLWDLDTSWVNVTLKANEIAQAIDAMESPIKIDTGYMWIKRGEPFAQRINDSSNDMARGMYLNVTVEYLTAY